MMAGFLNLNEDPLETRSLGAGLKARGTKPRLTVDAAAAARAGEAHGFTRTTDTIPYAGPRRGRPPLSEDMTYWRIYISPRLRDELNALRDSEGRRLNDVLEDMLRAYMATPPSTGEAGNSDG